MKKDLLTTLRFFSISTLVTYIGKPLNSSRKSKFLLILFFSIFYTTSNAQISHPFTASGSLPLPAGMDVVTVEAWGAGGAGGGANVTPLVGRSGGGGGGGAYARGTITTTGLSSLGVVVAPATAGGSGNGAQGGASYITGFTGVFNAPGGSGGNGNTTTTSTPTGGAGGTGAIGTLATAAGASGTNGSSAALSALLSSGGGGNGANFGSGGGAGGAAHASLILADLAGNNGATSGGGGGGAISSNTPQNGGSGARGSVNVTYTCKTYSITSLSATNVCTAVGTSSQVQLTSTAAGLPVGTYTVSYHRSNPSANNLTATMVVTTAGSGSFTATGFTNIGNSNIVVNTLTSVDCTSSIGMSTQISISAQPTITLGATTAVCASTSAQSTTLPYSAVTNAPTNYSITWSASPANSFAAVTNATLPSSPINIAIPAGTAAGTYTGSLTVSNVACVSTVNNFTVVVNPLPTITLGATTAVCTSASAQSTTLPYSATTNSPTTYSITWNASPTNTFAAVTNATLPSSPINIPIPAGTAAGTYTGNLTVRNANGCVSAVNNFTVVVNPLPTITLGTAAVCFNASAQTANLSYSSTTNSPTTYSITWNASPANSFVAVTNATLTSSPISIAVPAATPVGTYTGALTVRNANGCVSATNSFTVTVNALPTITLGTAGAVCSSTSAQTTNLTYSATTNSPTTYSIVWNASPTNSFATVTDATLTASPISIAVPANTAAGTYTGTLTVKNANGCVSAGNNFTVTVNPLPTITLGTAGAVCFNSSAQTTNLTYSATANSPTNYSITWNASPTNTFAAVADAALTASPISIAVPAGTAAGTYTGNLTVRNANGCISAVNNFTVTVNPPPTITLGTAGAVCLSTSAQTTNLTYSATTNSPTTYSITWNASPTNSFAAVTDAALTASPISISVPANTAAGTYTGTLTVKNANGCVSGGNSFTVTVNPLPTITLGTAGAVCSSSSAQTTNLTYSATTNTPTTYTITWNASPTNSFATVTNATLTASPISIAVPAGTAAGTYTGNLTVRNVNGCISAVNNFTVTVNPTPTITLGTAGSVCSSSSAQTTNLTYSATTNSPTTYSIVWNASPTNSFATITDATLTASPISISVPANTAVGTYTGTLTVKNASGCVSAANNFTVTVNPTPTITLGTAGAVCSSSSAQTTNLTYSATTNSPTTYSIVWNASPTNSFVTVTDATLTASPISIAVPAGTVAGTYTGTLIVKNANGCVSAANNFTVTVNATPTITLGTAGAVCSSSSAQTTNLAYSATTNSPTTYSIVWNASPTNSFVAVTDATLTASPISISIPANTAAGTYTGTLTVKNASGCVSAANNFTVTVNANPTITLGTAGAVCQSASAQTTNLAYSATTNSPTTYSITWNASPTNSFAAVTNAVLSASPISIAVPAGTTAGTYTGNLTVRNANGCVSAVNTFTILVNPLPTITTSGVLGVSCQSTSAQTTSLAYSATTGSPNSYSIDWATIVDQGATTFAFTSGAGTINNINIPANTAAGTYSGVMTISTANGCLATQAVSLTINAVPTITTSGTFTPVCQNSTAQTTSLAYTSTTNSPTSYSIDWVTLTDQGTTPFAFSSGSGNIVNVNVPANTPAGTYNGVMTIVTANGCPANQAVSLTVNAVSAAPTASATQQPSCQNNSGVITVTSPASGTGYSYSIDGVDFSNTSGIFTGLVAGSYTVKVKNTASGCESPSTPIIINPLINKVWNGNIDASWGNAANWTPAGVPLASDCVEIPDVATNPIISGTDGTFFANRITIENNGYLIVESTNTLTVTNEVNVVGNGVFIFENNSSLVQISDAVNTGNITYRRNTKPVRRYDLTYWSSPITRVPAFTLHDLSPNTLYDKFYKYDPVARWIINYNGTQEMVKGNGYNVRAPQIYDINSTQIYTAEFVGVPNNGTISGPAAVAEKSNLFGNPYPSAIYADQFIHDNAANIYGTLYFWTHNTPPSASPGSNVYSYSNDDFAIYNLSGETTVGGLTGVGATTPGNQEAPSGYIAAGQGFFAKARTNQSVVFTNSMRVPGRNTQFYKSSAVTTIERHRVWLNMTNTQGAFKQLLIGYAAGATNSWDNNFDALSMDANPYLDFYSINEGKKLVIQGRALPFVVTDTVTLGYRSAIEGDFTIAIHNSDGNLSTQDIYLQDKTANIIHNLRSGGYTFSTTTGVFQDRFILRYINPEIVLGNDDFEGSDNRIIVSVKDKNIKLQSASDQENLQETAIYDAGGKLLYQKKGINNREWTITNFQSGPQVLLLKITTEDGKTVSKKIIFQ
ncbi:T9SS sorting signal type C domain-containing protein [Flavobacterium ginsenosidimutans]|uniref:T9SS sorting signal type C domain-containing protein n=1 Tax=Flavobacterium ginsenosidimutans TaxID=687844 RepID=UPI003D992C67